MFQYDTDPYLELLDNFHPIPLTPGVLEKIKEVYIYEYGTRGRRGKIEVNDGDNELRFDLMTKERKAHEGNCPEIIPVVLGVVLIPQITHLHHLQQLYRILSGKELTIDWT